MSRVSITCSAPRHYSTELNYALHMEGHPEAAWEFQVVEGDMVSRTESSGAWQILIWTGFCLPQQSDLWALLQPRLCLSILTCQTRRNLILLCRFLRGVRAKWACVKLSAELLAQRERSLQLVSLISKVPLPFFSLAIYMLKKLALLSSKIRFC